MNAYFQIMLQLLWLFMLFTCIAIPLMMFFARFDGTKGQVGYATSQYSLGNMGGSSTFCTQFPFMQPLILECSSGVLSTAKTSELTGEPIF